MPDPLDPNPTTPPPPMPAGTGTTGTTGLPSNVAAALACIPLIGGIIFYVIEKHDRFVRFYAMQSIIFGGAWIMLSIVHTMVRMIFGSIPGIGGVLILLWALVWAVISIALLVLFIITVVKAFTGVRWEIPGIGPIARQQVDGPTVS